MHSSADTPANPVASRPLTPKQSAFVAEYLVDLNATQAAIRAGYSAKTADRIGPELLGKTWVAAAIAEGKARRSESLQISAEWVLQRLKDNADRAMQAEPVLDRHGEETGEYTYQGAVANRALELLGKHVGLFGDKVEHTGAAGGPIAVTITHVIVDPHGD